jgi:hypothetical protein
VGVSDAEYAALDLVYYETRLRSTAAQWTSRHWRAYGKSTQPSSVYDAAIASLIAAGRLQVIDESAIHRISAYLKCQPAIGPLDGLPSIGSLDFTIQGLQLWNQMLELRYGKQEANRLYWNIAARGASYPNGTCEIFAYSVSSLCEFAEAIEAQLVSSPIAIGPWRCQWWHLIPSGCRAIVKV